MGKEASMALKHLATMISEKTGDHYGLTMSLLRCRLSFCLLRSAITCLRGSRTVRRPAPTVEDPTTLMIHESGISVD